MKFINTLTDDTVLKEIGTRLSRSRLNLNKTQAQLAEEAGVSHRTLSRAEHGESIQLSSLVRILRALDLLKNLDALVSSPVTSPIQQLKSQGRQRQRASSKKDTAASEASWSWGDDS